MEAIAWAIVFAVSVWEYQRTNGDGVAAVAATVAILMVILLTVLSWIK